MQRDETTGQRLPIERIENRVGINKKSLMKTNWSSEAVRRRRTDNTIVKRGLKHKQ